MKKIFSASAVALVVALAACSKSSTTTNPGTNLATNTFSIDNNVYKLTYITLPGGFLSASDTSYSSGISFYFYNGQTPTSSHTYKISSYPATSSDQIAFGTMDSTGEYVSSSDNANVFVSISVASNGKLTITMPPAKATNPGGGVIKHIAANIKQP